LTGRKYRPINGRHLGDVVEDEYTKEEIPLDMRFGINITKQVPRITLWKDEDWTFMSLGKRVNTGGVMETRTYCPACVREVDTINIGRKRRSIKWKNAAAKKKPRAREELRSDDEDLATVLGDGQGS
jgi:hypothetical protein